MKTIQVLVISLIIVSCSQLEPSSNHEILDEYLLLNYNSWNSIKNTEYNMIPRYQVDDTVILKSEIRLMIMKNDTTSKILLSPENFANFEKSTKLKLIWSNDDKFYNHLFHFVTLETDSTIRGIITTDDLKINQEGPLSPVTEKNMFLEKVMNERNRFDRRIMGLADKYDMTEDSLFGILAKQYYETTGIPVMGH